MGDFNTYLPEVTVRDRVDNRSLYFQSFLRENNVFSTNTSELCNGAKSTFVTYDGRHESLIDHILVPIEKSRKVSHCEIIHDNALNVSRHRPVHCALELPSCNYDDMPSDLGPTSINWRKVDQACITEYQNIIQNSEQMAHIIQGDLETPRSIDQAYSVLVSEVTTAAEKSLPKKSFKRFLKPYWNLELQGLHRKMKLYRNAWVKSGKTRQPNQTTYTDYKSAKRNFRQCHRKHANVYLQGQLEEIDRPAEVDSAHFWRLVNARRKVASSSSGSEMVFGGHMTNTAKDINIGWGHYFKELYTPAKKNHFDNQFYDTITQEVELIKSRLQNSDEAQSYPVISPNEVESAVRLAQNNKAGGTTGSFMNMSNTEGIYYLKYCQDFTPLSLGMHMLQRL